MGESAELMIEITDLTKRYGALTAVDELNLRVEPGEVLGFLGPNGAGKSTTMKMVAGFLAPTSGSIRVCGHDVEEAPIESKRCMGYLPEGAPAYGEMTPRQFLGFVADVRGLSGDFRRQRLDEVYQRLHLEGVLDQTIETLSKGFRRRVGLAQAIVHDPKVLVLDEPTDGLDPNQKHEVRALIEDMSSDKIIVVSTHILEEVSAVCNRAVIIARGRVLADNTPEALSAQSRYHNAVVLEADDAASVAERLQTVAGATGVDVDADRGRIVVFPEPGGTVYDAVSARVAEFSLPIRRMTVEAGRLDDVFRAITTQGGEVRT